MSGHGDGQLPADANSCATASRISRLWAH